MQIYSCYDLGQLIHSCVYQLQLLAQAESLRTWRSLGNFQATPANIVLFLVKIGKQLAIYAAGRVR